MSCTTALQQGRMAAGARSRSVLGGGYLWSAAITAVAVNVCPTVNFMDHTEFTTKRPTRPLGGHST
jgi:hypothetical protein